MPRKNPNAADSTAKAQQDAASDGIDAYELPKSIVTKLARSALPENAKMQKETVIALTKGSTVFVNYLAATAHDVATQKQHKSVSATDVLKALELLDLGDMLPKLQEELQAHRDLQKADKGKRAAPKPKPKDAESASTKAKGKAKAAPSATIILPSRGSRQDATSEPAEEDEPAAPSTARNLDEDEEMADADDQEEPEDELDEEEDVGDEDEGEELVDQLELEEAELRTDARGVEERDHHREED